jgi:hypothetical protein
MVLAHTAIGTIENGFAITHVYRFSRCMRHAITVFCKRCATNRYLKKIPDGGNSAAIFLEREHK